MIAHRSPISGVATFGGHLVATAGYDNQLILWDANEKRPIARAVHDHLANQTAFSPDGRFLVSSSSDHTARLWSVPDLKLKAVFSEQSDDVEMSVFHPNEPLIATASRDHHVRVYDFQGCLSACFKGHTADVISVAWSECGGEVISSSDDGTIKRWSLGSGEMVANIDLGGVETDTIAISQDGVIYAGNDEGQIIAIHNGKTVTYDAHSAGIKRLVHQPAENLLVSLSYDRTLRIWAARRQDLKPVAEASMPAEIWPRSCAFLSANTLAFATFGSAYALYYIREDRWDLSSVVPTGGVNAVTVHDGQKLTIGDAGVLRADGIPRCANGSLCNFLTPAGSRVFTGGQMGQVFDALTGELLYQHRSPINCAAAFMVQGRQHVVVGTYTGEGLVFRVDSDAKVHFVTSLQLHSNAVKAVAVSGGQIFAVCADTSASWFSVDTFCESNRVHNAHKKIANGCAALPEGRFVSISRDLKLRLWTGTKALAIDTPHTHSIKCVATSEDGRYVATGSYFGAVAIYDIQLGLWTCELRPTAAGVSSLHFDVKAKSFLAGAYDGDVYEIGADKYATAQ